jgi:hypothetical protein
MDGLADIDSKQMAVDLPTGDELYAYVRTALRSLKWVRIIHLHDKVPEQVKTTGDSGAGHGGPVYAKLKGTRTEIDGLFCCRPSHTRVGKKGDLCGQILERD